MTRDDREAFAAEYVVGLLEGEQQREAERLLSSDAEFHAAVLAWQARLSELDQTAAPDPPGDQLWLLIEQDIASKGPQVQKPSVQIVVPDPVGVFTTLWRSLPFWRVAGLAGALASVALAVGLGYFAERSSRTPVLVAVLLTDANQPAGIINAYADGRAQLVAFEGMQIPAGRAFEVWAIPGPNQNPISVGVLTEPRSSALDLQRVPSLSPNQTFAISVEPPQGSPTGLPTGPVLMKGTTTTAL